MKGKNFSKGRLQSFNERQLFPSVSAKIIPSSSQPIHHSQQKVEVPIAQVLLEEQSKIYEWRVKTEFPIVKVYEYRIARREGLRVVLTVGVENYPLRLTELSQLPLFKVLYLLKESIIGFERLFYKFGPFLVTPKMIALNSQSKCKIWLNQNFASNAFIPCHMEQKQFLQTIYKIFLEISNKLKNTIHFFKELCYFTSFCQALNFIENYARQNRISIPASCKITEKQSSLMQSKSNTGFNPSLTMTRAPKFLNSTNLRSSLKSSAKNPFEQGFKHGGIPKLEANSICSTLQMTETIQMKTSGDTAADIYGSNSAFNSIQEDKEIFDESIIFGEIQKTPLRIPQSPLTFSKVGKRQLTVTKNLSDNVDANTFFNSTSVKFSTKIDKSPIPNFKSCREIMTEEEDHQNLEASTKMANIFQKNKWEKTLCGLFNEGSDDMKKSTQHGAQKRKTPNSEKRLFLLQSVSKDLHESFMNEDNSH